MARFASNDDRRAALAPIVRRLRGEGSTLAQIAAAVGVPRGTVATWLRRKEFGLPGVGQNMTESHLRATIARLESVYLEAIDAWENSKTGKTVETTVAVDENNFVRSQKANRRVTTTSHGDPAYLYVAIRAVEACSRARVILDGRPASGEFDRLMVLGEESFIRRVREMDDREINELETTLRDSARSQLSLPAPETAEKDE